MRSFIVMAMFLASFSHAAWNEYTEVRELKLDADGIDSLAVDAGAGSIDIKGVTGLDSIVVTATIIVPDADENDAKNVIEEKMKLALDRVGEQATLDSWFEQGWFGGGSNARIDVAISMPIGIDVSVDDGSGSIDVSDLAAAVSIDDGSGSIELNNVASVYIDDGSGSISISNATGDVTIVDGSGSITVRSVDGSVSIDDGSGGIDVSDVERDLIIVDDGSGGFDYSDVRGRVDHDS